MRVRIEIIEDEPEEVIIRCKKISSDIIRLQQLLSSDFEKKDQFVLYKGDTEYYIDTGQILFFETEGTMVVAHTANDAYETRLKLYELEETLSGAFQRISKSSIVNVSKIYSIKRNVTASSEIEFKGTHKQIYVSRAYYKALKTKLEEMR